MCILYTLAVDICGTFSVNCAHTRCTNSTCSISTSTYPNILTIFTTITKYLHESYGISSGGCTTQLSLRKISSMFKSKTISITFFFVSEKKNKWEVHFNSEHNLFISPFGHPANKQLTKRKNARANEIEKKA